MAERARSAEVDELRAQLAANQPYLGLARRSTPRSSGSPPIPWLISTSWPTDRPWPREARHAAVTAAFRELPAGERWEILARLFDDDELRAALAVEHEARAVVRAGSPLRRAFDTRLLPAGEELVVGLFREVDVRAALARGSASTSSPAGSCCGPPTSPGGCSSSRTCSTRRVACSSRPTTTSRRGARSAWPRTPPSPSARPPAAGRQPVIYPGGRLDIETADGIRIGRLHIGCVDRRRRRHLHLITTQEGDRLT